MARIDDDDSLQVVPPQAIDEQSPLLGNADGQPDNGTIEAQAEQERREYEAGHVPLAEEPPLSKMLVIMGSLWACSFFAALDTTVVATLSGPISVSFQSGTAFSWIASGYLIANAAIQPLSGKMTDIYGRRAGLIFAVTFFAVGTLICGLAPTEGVMILGRLIAGAGGGCLNTVSVFVASDLIPLRKRGLWQGAGNVVYGAGTGLGGIFGGYINDRYGWRYAFYIQVPLVALAGILGCFLVKVPIKETDTAKIKRVDFLGAFTLVTSLVLLLLGLNSGGNIVPWNHPLVYVSLPLSFICLLLFIFIEDRVASEPIIPVRLLLNRSVAGACLTNWFQTASFFCLYYYVPIFFQVVRGMSPSDAGYIFIPQATGTALGSVASGIFMRWTGKYWWLLMFTQTLATAATASILATFTPGVAPAVPYILIGLNGFAYGGMLTMTLLSLISAVDHKYQAVMTSASYAFRSTGSTMGITIAGVVFQNLLKAILYDHFGDQPGAADKIRRIRDSAGSIKDLPHGWREGVIDAYINALRGVWTCALGLAVLAFIASTFIREYKLHLNLERK